MDMFKYKKYTKNDLLNMPVSTLAWIGDAVYTMCVRNLQVQKNAGKPAKLNKMATEWVNAGAQSDALDKIEAFLTEDEANVVRRAKNAPITTKSKHYGIADYKRATGLEAVVGYLYLLDEQKRLNEIFNIIFEEKVNVNLG